MGVEAPDARNLPVRADTRVPRSGQCGGKGVKVVDEQRGVRLTRGSERLFYPEMQHSGARGEPAAAASREHWRLSADFHVGG